MLLFTYRLAKDKDFQRVFKQGKLASGEFIVIKFLKNNTKQTHIGFIVGSKVSKKANVRNLIKRRLRHAMKEFLRDLSKGFDIIVMVKPSIENKDFSEIKEDLRKILKKSGLLYVIK
jgi:ribonuclease P protein component